MMLRIAEFPCFSSPRQTWWLQKQPSESVLEIHLQKQGGDLLFNPSFSAASGISISEQWCDRAGDEITRFLPFLSRGCNSSTVCEVQLKLTALPSPPHCWAPALSLPEQQTRHNGRGPTCGTGGSTTNTHGSQCKLIHKSPSSYTQGLGQVNGQKPREEVLLFILKK